MDDDLYKILSTFASRKSFSLNELGKHLNVLPQNLANAVDFLLVKNLLQYLPDTLTGEIPKTGQYHPKAQIQITVEGKAALNNYIKRERQYQSTELKFRISTAISIISLIISAISLIMRFY